MANQRCDAVMTRDPECCGSKDSALDAIRIMKNRNVGFVPVCDKDNRLIGVLTDRDIAMALNDDRHPSKVKLNEIMTRDPITVRPEEDIHDCARRMEEFQLHRIPVTDHDNILVGVIALADIARKAVQKRDLEGELPRIVESFSQP